MYNRRSGTKKSKTFYYKQIFFVGSKEDHHMEEIKLDKNKLNKSIDQAANLPEVPRTIEGKIDLEAIAIGKNEKENFIVPDEILKAYYKELPNGTVNQSGTFTAYNKGLLRSLDNDIRRKGGEALQAELKQRRTIQETVKIMLAQKATPEELEAYNLPAGATKQDAMTAAMLARVIEQKDVAAFNSLRDTAGEKPTDRISAEVETITAEDRAHIERILNRTKAQDIVSGPDQE